MGHEKAAIARENSGSVTLNQLHLRVISMYEEKWARSLLLQRYGKMENGASSHRGPCPYPPIVFREDGFDN